MRLFLALSIGACLAQALPASARTPLPFHQGVTEFAVHCGGPTDSVPRAELCAAAGEILAELTGRPVTIGPGQLGNPNAITVLMDAHLVATAGHEFLTIHPRLLRRGKRDGRLYGPPPIVQIPPKRDCDWKDLRTALRDRLTGLVQAPWMASNPKMQRQGKQ